MASENIKIIKEKIINIDHLFKLVKEQNNTPSKSDTNLKQKAENQNLLKIIDRQKQEIESYISKTEFISNKLRSTDSYNIQLKAQVEELSDKLKKSTQDTNKKPVSPNKELGKNKKDKQTILSIKSKLDEIELQNKKLKAENAKVSILEKEISKKDEIISNLQKIESQKTTANNDKSQELALKIQELNKMLNAEQYNSKNLADEITKCNQSLQHLNTKLKDKEEQFKKYEHETCEKMSKMQSKLSQCERMVDVSQTKLSKDQNTILSLSKKLAETENELNSSRSQVQRDAEIYKTMKQKLEEQEQQLNEYKLKIKERSMLESKAKSSENFINDKTKRILKDYQAEIHQLSKDKNALIKELEIEKNFNSTDKSKNTLVCSNENIINPIDPELERHLNSLYVEIEKLVAQKKALQEALTDNLVQMNSLKASSQGPGYSFLRSGSINLSNYPSVLNNTNSLVAPVTSRAVATASPNISAEKPSLKLKTNSFDCSSYIIPQSKNNRITKDNLLDNPKTLIEPSYSVLSNCDKIEKLPISEEAIHKKDFQSSSNQSDRPSHESTTLNVECKSSDNTSICPKPPQKKTKSKPKKTVLLSSEQLGSLQANNSKEKNKETLQKKPPTTNIKKKLKVDHSSSETNIQDILTSKLTKPSAPTININTNKASLNAPSNKTVSDPHKKPKTSNTKQLINESCKDLPSTSSTDSNNASLKSINSTQPINTSKKVPDSKVYNSKTRNPICVPEIDSLCFIDIIPCYPNCSLKTNILSGLNFLHKPYDMPFFSTSLRNYEILVDTQQKLDQFSYELAQLIINYNTPSWSPYTAKPRIFEVYYDDLNSIEYNPDFLTIDKENNITRVKTDQSLLNNIKFEMSSDKITLFENSLVCFVLLLSVQYNRIDIIGSFVNQICQLVLLQENRIPPSKKPFMICSSCRIIAQLLQIQENRRRCVVFCYDLLVCFVDEPYLLSGMSSVAQIYPQALTSSITEKDDSESYLLRCFKSIIGGVYECILHDNQNNKEKEQAHAFYDVFVSLCRWEQCDNIEYIDVLDTEITKKINMSATSSEKFILERCLYLISIYYPRKNKT